jgi:hypothetical protein
MNWRLISALALAGPMIGAAVVFGLSEGRMLSAWAVVRVVCAIWIAQALRDRHFAHGFLVGAIGCAIAVATKFVFYDTYVAHAPEYVENLRESGFGEHSYLWIPALALVWVLLHGLVQGALAWFAAKFIGSR